MPHPLPGAGTSENATWCMPGSPPGGQQLLITKSQDTMKSDCEVIFWPPSLPAAEVTDPRRDYRKESGETPPSSKYSSAVDRQAGLFWKEKRLPEVSHCLNLCSTHPRPHRKSAYVTLQQ